MRRILCIWLPNWPLQRLLGARPELKRQAVALYEQRRGLTVVACSRRANQRGIVPGMPVAETTDVHLEKYDPAADRAALEQLAQECEPFSPTVGLEDAQCPDSLLLDISGLAPLLGDEQSLAEQVAKTFARRGLKVRLGLADSLGAAWAVAHYAVAHYAVAHHADPLWIVRSDQTLPTLARLPVKALRLSADTVQLLAELGIHQIGQLLALPRASLASRFEPQLMQRLNQALGSLPEMILAHRAPAEIIVERQLEYPVDRRDTIEFVLAQLVDQVTATLMARQQGAIRLECELVCEDARSLRFVVGLFQATAEPRHLRELVETQLARLQVPGPVVAVRLAVLLAARLQSPQRELFDDHHDNRRELALLVDRLSSRLHREAVLCPILMPDAQPEYAYRYEPLAGSKRKKTKGQQGIRHRPLLVEPRPVPLEAFSVVPDGLPSQFRFQGRQQRVARSWGPERIRTGWWRGNYIWRDYYRVETTSGDRFWIFRRDGGWFLQGVFD